MLPLNFLSSLSGVYKKYSKDRAMFPMFVFVDSNYLKAYAFSLEVSHKLETKREDKFSFLSYQELHFKRLT